mgnify:CR=1 FL=1
MENLEDIKVGDKVILYSRFQDRTVCKVDRLTKNFIIVEGRKYRKKDGFEAGDCGFYASSIERATELVIAEVEEENKRYAIISYIRNCRLSLLPTDVLEKVYKLIKK